MPAELVLGNHPGRLTVRLVRGEDAVLVATQVDASGQPINWDTTPSLEFAPAYDCDILIVSLEAAVSGNLATWTLSIPQVEALAAASKGPYSKSIATLAHISVPDAADGKIIYAGKVDWKDEWTPGDDRTTRVSYTVTGPAGPVGPPGPVGPAGPSGGETYIHTQSTPAATWTILHNLGRVPPVVLLINSEPNTLVFTDITYPDLSTVVVEWPSAESGKAYL